jgi:signal transduction histidine kinase
MDTALARPVSAVTCGAEWSDRTQTMNGSAGNPQAAAAERMLTASLGRLLIAASLIEMMGLPAPHQPALVAQRRWAVAMLGLLVLAALLALPSGRMPPDECAPRSAQVGWTVALAGLAALVVALSGGGASPLAYLFLLPALVLSTDTGLAGGMLVGALVLACVGPAQALSPRSAQGALPYDAAAVEALIVAGFAACVFVLRVAQARRPIYAAQLRNLALTWKTEALALERTRGELLAHVSHELMTPVAAIQACAGLLVEARADQRDAPPAGHDEPLELRLAGNIQRNAARLALLVDDLLELARMEETRPVLRCAWCDCGEVLRRAVDAVAPLCESRRQALTWQVASDGLRVWGDVRRVEQIVINLLANAHKYAGDGATITASARRERGGTRLEVRDDGPGLPTEAIPRLFDRYYRGPGSAGQGSGLGLAIAQAQVRLHGGRIWAENNAGRGCRFCCWLPDPKVAALAVCDVSGEDLV